MTLGAREQAGVGTGAVWAFKSSILSIKNKLRLSKTHAQWEPGFTEQLCGCQNSCEISNKHNTTIREYIILILGSRLLYFRSLSSLPYLYFVVWHNIFNRRTLHVLTAPIYPPRGLGFFFTLKLTWIFLTFCVLEKNIL